jgi:hypothetical protein
VEQGFRVAVGDLGAVHRVGDGVEELTPERLSARYIQNNSISPQ